MNVPTWLALHRELCDEARALSERKGHDYSGVADTLKNLKVSAAFGHVSPEHGVLVRIGDKVARLWELTAAGAHGQVKDESVRDTVLDLLNYACLLCALIQDTDTSTQIDARRTAGQAEDPEAAPAETGPHCPKCGAACEPLPHSMVNNYWQCPSCGNIGLGPRHDVGAMPVPAPADENAGEPEAGEPESREVSLCCCGREFYVDTGCDCLWRIALAGPVR